MRKPENSQLEAVCAHCFEALRGDTKLLQQMDCGPDLVVASVFPYRVLYPRDNGAVDVYATSMPCLAIYANEWPSENVRSYRGFHWQLGIQYLYEVPEAEEKADVEAIAAAINATVWWHLARHMDNPSDATSLHPNGLLEDAKIDSLWPVTAEPLRPMENAVRGFEGSAGMQTVWPPYYRAALPDLDSIAGTYDHTGVPAEDALLESVTDVS